MQKIQKIKPPLLRIMKYSLCQLLLVCLFSTFSVANSFTQDLLNRTVSLRADNVEFKQVLNNLEKAADVKFVYSSKAIQPNRKVSINATERKLSEVLEMVLRPLQINYQVVGGQIILNSQEVGNIPIENIGILVALPAEETVKGKITDETGAGLPGANILLKGTKKGVSSNANGEFSISYPSGSNAVLVISSVGYISQEVSVGNRAVVNIILATDNKALAEVVVVGYGTQKKSDVTGSIASINDKALKEVPTSNMVSALQGRVAGLEIQRTGSTPGSGNQIRIRGERSINGSNDPLVVLDGIPFEGGNLNDINPNDIASVDVLKDASATAIYGSRGANGVILVTTKRGKSGETKLSYNGYHGITSVISKYPVYNAAQYQAMRNLSVYSSGYLAPELESIAKGQTTDWQDLMYKTGYITDHNITASGGKDDNLFTIGGGYFKETTVLPGQDFERFTLKASTDTKIGKRLKIGLSTFNTFNTINGQQFVYPMFPILTLSPLMPAYNADGSVVKAPAGNLDDANQYSPLLLNSDPNSWEDKTRRLRTFNNLYGEVQILDNLKYRLNIGADFSFQENAQFQKADSYFRAGQTSFASMNNAKSYSLLMEHLLYFDKTFGKHKVGFTGLWSVQKSQTYNTYTKGENLAADFIEYYDLSQASSNTLMNGSESSRGLISTMARVNYAYDDRYLITLTGRQDESSVLAAGHKAIFYPAVSLGWNITNEAFLKNNTVVSNLKLRAGTGTTANQSIGPYSTLGGVVPYLFQGGTRVPIKYNFGTTVVSGYNVNALPDANLTWESTVGKNIGVDFGFLNGRISGSIDYYSQYTKGVLYGVTLPPTSGITGQYLTNIGEMSNYGMEFSLSSVNVQSASGFKWSTDFNVSFNRNKLEKLDGSVTQNIANGLHVGYPLTAIYDYKKLGIWQLNEADEAAKYNSVPGQIKLADLNNDGKITDADRSVIGNSQADWQGGMTNRLNYKNFELSVVAFVRMGGTLVSALHQPLSTYATILDGRRNQLAVNYWTPNNPTNDFPMPSASISPIISAGSTLGYYDASFVKIRSINLAYNLPETLLKKMKMSGVKVYATATNPFILFAPYLDKGGIDPESSGQGSSGLVGGGPGNISSRNLNVRLTTPTTKGIIFGANISF
jgi:TonB-linked SusC/RagA family outer membrane protein